MSFMKAGIIAPEKMEQNIYTTISARNCVRLPGEIDQSQRRARDKGGYEEHGALAEADRQLIRKGVCRPRVVIVIVVI